MRVSGEKWRDSAIHIHGSILPPDSTPLQTNMRGWAEFPVLYSRSLLVTCFEHSNGYNSIPNFPTILSSLATISLFLKFVSLCLFCKFISIGLFWWLRWEKTNKQTKTPAMQETWVRSLSWARRMEWLPTPVFLPGKFHKQRTLVGYSP